MAVDENCNIALHGFLTADKFLPETTIITQPLTDNYTVESRPFARGKFATVRRIRHKESGVDYAAKYIRKRRRATDIRHEILHEVCVLKLSAASHRIVRLHEVYETPTETILVLELVSGGELQRVLDDEEEMTEVDVTRLMRQILEGIAFLHDRNIAHLDIKPQNLLLTGTYPKCDIKLCDFGISRVITKGVEIREIVGTPDYVAPEILQYEPISLATDMWSVGILAYVLLSGHTPFGGESKQETFCNITNAQLEFPPDLFASVSNHAKDFIRRLLVREPSERMTAKECIQHPWLQSTVPKVQLSLAPPGPLALPLQTLSIIPAEAVEEHVHQTAPEVVCKVEHRLTPVLEDPQQVILTMPEVGSRLDGRIPLGRRRHRRLTPSRQTLRQSITEMENMVVQLEGLSLGKRLIFSEEMIVDERMGIVF